MEYGLRSTEETFRNSEVVGVKRHYEVRVRVTNVQEELAAYLQFRDETAQKNCEFRIEHTQAGDKQGAYYIIKVWSE